ncbi:MAG: FAD-dependent oxidoreductase [Myxococcaceae bacterium]
MQAAPVTPLMKPRLGATPPPKRHGGLPSWSHPVVEALADTMIPTGKKLTRRAGPIALQKIDHIFAELPRLIRVALVAGLNTIEWSSVAFTGTRFSRLAPERRLDVLERWHQGNTSARVILRGLLTPIKIAYFSEDDVAAAVGYEPKPYHPPKRTGKHEGLPPGDIRIGRERPEEELSCDVVVIGSGAGGAVVARELAERGRKVVVIEEGQYWTQPQFTRRSFEMTRLMYRDLGFTVALGRPGIPIPLGMTVGGTTTINSGTCFRVPEHTLRRWRGAHGLDFTAEGLSPYFERVEKMVHARPMEARVMGNTGRLVSRGAEALGLHAKPLTRNADGCQGSGVCCFGCPEDAKQSMNLSYVPAALAKGATLYTETRAQKVLFEKGRAVGVLAQMGPEKKRLKVRAEAVVVAAGTIFTPVFLGDQGIGKRSGQLGRNLSIHPATKVAALFDDEVRCIEGVPQGMYIHDLAEEGIMFEGASLTPDYAAIGLPFYGPKLVEVMEQYRHLASFGLMVEDESQGQVRKGLDGRPLILYSLKEKELRLLRKGTEILCRLFFKAGARVVFPPLGGLPELRSEDQVNQIRYVPLSPEDFELSAFHPLGTCRMAVDPKLGVIDPDLEAHEADRLFVVDGSIFASSLGVNPQLTIMAFATRAAERIDQRLQGDGRRYSHG